jgi:predicted glycosyltransferase
MRRGGESAHQDTAATAGPVTGAGVRMLMYSHDTFGLGHLQRCLKIARALTARYPELSILLVTGSPLVHRYELPPQVDYIKLPAVRKTGQERYEARSLATPFERILGVRTRLLLETAREYLPQIVLVDHSPTGMKNEMLPTLRWLKEHAPESSVILGLRDIIDDPSLVVPLWENQEIYDALEHLYSDVLVYGSRDVFDPVAAYRFSPTLQEKTHFCHYIVDSPRRREANDRDRRPGAQRPLVVVTIGGGDGAFETVIDPYVDMLARHRDRVDFDSVILTGPFAKDDELSRARRKSEGLPVAVKRFVPGTGSLLRRSSLIVATAGYNTTTEILNFGQRAILIPRMLHRKEQFLRASRLAGLGLVTMLHPEQVTPDGLFEAVSGLLRSESRPLAEGRRAGRVPLDGAARLVAWFHDVLVRHSPSPGDTT